MRNTARTTMSSSRAGDSLSHRLKSIKNYHTNQRNIWDIGCDHGQLGLSFVASDVDSIHLVDPSKPVINKLKDSYITIEKVFITESEGQKLTLDSLSNCIFIAGMGGKEIGEIILHLLPQLDHTSRIVISPHRRILELRKLLGSLPLTLIEERVFLDEGQFYPVLCLSPGAGKKVHEYGEELWVNETGEEYRLHQIKFFSAHQDLASQSYVTYLNGLNPMKIGPKIKS